MAVVSSLMLAPSLTNVHRAPAPFSYEYHGTKKASVVVRCTLQNSVQSAAVATTAAALLIFVPMGEVSLAQPKPNGGSMCEIAADLDASGILNLNAGSEGDDAGGPLIMSAGMTMKNFNPARYSGRWYEVASLKLGFAGQGQQDCHCTQGIYSYNDAKQSIEVETFCVHGSPTGYITGIRGRVQCVTDRELAKLKLSEFERMQMLQQKCYLRFPNLPFIPRQPYNVLDTDYDSYALVSGAKDASFIQIYSRTPNPGRDFIDTQKAALAKLGYSDDIVDTPQDCEEQSVEQLEAMMASPGMESVLNNPFEPLRLSKGVQLNPFTSNLETIKKLIQLYLPKFGK